VVNVKTLVIEDHGVLSARTRSRLPEIGHGHGHGHAYEGI
jgi:hypothetical protein